MAEQPANGSVSVKKRAAAKTDKKKSGPKPQYDNDVFIGIMDRMSRGERLSEICREEGMPCRNKVYDWKDSCEENGGRFARARDMGALAIFEEVLEIADNGTNDWMEKYGQDGEAIGYELNGEHVQRSKLRVETRLKYLAILDSAKYGNKQRIEHDVTDNLADRLARARQRASGGE